MASAERVFRSALTFVYCEDNNLLSEDNHDARETVLARQIALFNMARLHECALNFALAEHYFMLSLSQGEVVHLSTTTQTLGIVCTHLATQDPNRATLGIKLQKLAEAHNMSPKTSDSSGAAGSKGGVAGSKRVAFALDYSGSMAGSKIRAAVESLESLFTTQLQPQDELMILLFSSSCSVELPFTKKSGNEKIISSKINSLQRPGGGTALYDGMWDAVEALQSTKSRCSGPTNDWVVVLTDGQEGSSRHNRAQLQCLLRTATCGFVMIGVGEDVFRSELEGFVGCAKKGYYVSAAGDKKGIEEAFGQVAVLIQGQVIMEDL